MKVSKKIFNLVIWKLNSISYVTSIYTNFLKYAFGTHHIYKYLLKPGFEICGNFPETLWRIFIRKQPTSFQNRGKRIAQWARRRSRQSWQRRWRRQAHWRRDIARTFGHLAARRKLSWRENRTGHVLCRLSSCRRTAKLYVF